MPWYEKPDQLDSENIIPDRLRGHEVETIPGLYYVDEYITPDEEEALLKRIYDAHASWRSLKNRRLQNWGGLPHEKGMVPLSIPSWLSWLCEKLQNDVLFENTPNHILINEYEAGQGIAAHTDGPVYEPMAAIISLKNPIVMDFRRRDDFNDPRNNGFSRDDNTKIIGSLVLKPRSLVLMSGESYSYYLHGIEERLADDLNGIVLCNKGSLSPDILLSGIIPRKLRLSLTIRKVKKVLKTRIFL